MLFLNKNFMDQDIEKFWKMCDIYISKIYDHSHRRYREFGTSPQGTLCPIWLVTGLASVFAYALVSAVENGTGRLQSTAHTPTSKVSHSTHNDTPGLPVSSYQDIGQYAPMNVTNGVDTFESIYKDNDRPRPLRTTETIQQSAMRRRTMAGGGGGGVNINMKRNSINSANNKTNKKRQSTPSHDNQPISWNQSSVGNVDTRSVRHADSRRQHQSVKESRIWKWAMD